MSAKRASCLLFLWGVGAAGVALAGTYNHVPRRVRLDDSDPDKVEPFAVVHPIGYDSTNTTIEVSVCVDPDDGVLVGPTQAAIEEWDALVKPVSSSRHARCRARLAALPPPAPATARCRGRGRGST